MEPISLILAALVAGVAKGAGDSAAAAVKDAYTGLREALRKRWTTASAEPSLDEYLAAPDAGSAVVEAHLAQAHADEDEEVLAAAHQVLTLADPLGARAGKYSVNASGSQGVQIGEGNAQTNYFGPAS